MIAGRVDAPLYGHNHDGRIAKGVLGIPLCLDAGSSTPKEIGDPTKLRREWVIDLSETPAKFYDGVFHCDARGPGGRCLARRVVLEDGGK